MNATAHTNVSLSTNLDYHQLLSEVTDLAGSRLFQVVAPGFTYLTAYTSWDDKAHLYLMNHGSSQVIKTSNMETINPNSLLGDVWSVTGIDEQAYTDESLKLCQAEQAYNDLYTGSRNPFPLDEHEFYLDELTDHQALDAATRSNYSVKASNISCNKLSTDETIASFNWGCSIDKINSGLLQVVEVTFDFELIIKSRKKTYSIKVYLGHNTKQNTLSILNHGVVYVRDNSPQYLKNLNWEIMIERCVKSLHWQIIEPISDQLIKNLNNNTLIGRLKTGEYRSYHQGFNLMSLHNHLPILP